MTRGSRLLTLALGTSIALTLGLAGPAAHAATPGPIASSSTPLTLPGAGVDWTLLGISHDGNQAYAAFSTDSGYALSLVSLPQKSITATVPIKDDQGTPVSTVDSARILMNTNHPQAFDSTTGAVVANAKNLTATSNIAVGPRGVQVYVVDQWLGKLVALNATSLSPVWSVPVCARDFANVDPADPESPGPTTGVSITPDGATVIVSCSDSGMQFLSAKSGKLLGSIPSLKLNVPVAVSADGSTGYVVRGTNVYSINIARHAITRTASLYASSDGPRGSITDLITPTISPDGRSLFVALPIVGVLKRIDARTLAATSIPVGGKTRWGAIEVAASSQGNNVYALSKSSLVTINSATKAVLGIDPAAPAGMAAEHVVAGNSAVAITWETTQASSDIQAGVSVLTFP